MVVGLVAAIFLVVSIIALFKYRQTKVFPLIVCPQTEVNSTILVVITVAEVVEKLDG